MKGVHLANNAGDFFAKGFELRVELQYCGYD